jgi:hypothetical protein
MAKRVYKFTTAKFGITNIRDHHLKLSTIDDLNDPFDLAPLDITDLDIRRAQEALVVFYRKRMGLLCFSRNWDNLLLWSHYGESHKGICCGFDIADGSPGANYDTDVLYQPNVLQITRPADVNFDLASRLLRTKHESWSYEQEVRMFVGLDDPPDSNGLRWANFGPLVELKEVIIGSQADPSVTDDVRQALNPYGDSVRCSWAGMRPDAFLLVKQDHPPHWHSEV